MPIVFKPQNFVPMKPSKWVNSLCLFVFCSQSRQWMITTVTGRLRRRPEHSVLEVRLTIDMGSRLNQKFSDKRTWLSGLFKDYLTQIWGFQPLKSLKILMKESNIWSKVATGKSVNKSVKRFFLAHLSTKCSSELLWSFNVRPPSSVRPCVRPSTISLNNISSETAYWILTKLHRNDPWVVLYQNCSNRSSWLHK